MSGKLLADLQAQGVQSLSFNSLNELKWKTKRQIYMTLMTKRDDAATILGRIRTLEEDRKIEKQVEREQRADVHSKHDSEMSYRSEFCQLIATELQELGAPMGLQWELLLSDKDANFQAYRLLLTRLKSSKHRPRPTSSRKSREIAKAKNFQVEERPAWDNAFVEDEIVSTTKSIEEKVRVPQPSPQRPAWNGSFDQDEVVSEIGGAITASPRMPTHPQQKQRRSLQQQPKKPAEKTLKRNKNDTAANSTLELENKRLTKRLAEVEELYANLISSNADEPARFNEKRMNFLKAQNFQMQRQLDVLLDTIQAQQDSRAAFSALFSQLSSIVSDAQESAQDAISDGKQSTEINDDDSQHAWFFKVPRKLLKELSNIQARVAESERSSGRKLHESLFYVPASENDDFGPSFGRDSDTSSTIHVHGHGYASDIAPISHLRFDRLHQLETQLAVAVDQLQSFSNDVLIEFGGQPSPLSMQHRHGSRTSSLCEKAHQLSRDTRQLAMECAWLGTMVCTQAVGPGSAEEVMSTCDPNTTPHTILSTDVVKWLPPFPLAHRDKEKKVRGLLKRLDAQHASLSMRLSSCETDLKLWHEMNAKQYRGLHTLMGKLKSLWEDKILWVQDKMVEGLLDMQRVYEELQQSQEIQAVPRSSYLRLFLDTFEEKHVSILESKVMFKKYVQGLHMQLKESVQEFNEAVASIEVELLYK